MNETRARGRETSKKNRSTVTVFESSGTQTEANCIRQLNRLHSHYTLLSTQFDKEERENKKERKKKQRMGPEEEEENKRGYTDKRTSVHYDFMRSHPCTWPVTVAQAREEGSLVTNGNLLVANDVWANCAMVQGAK